MPCGLRFSFGAAIMLYPWQCPGMPNHTKWSLTSSPECLSECPPGSSPVFPPQRNGRNIPWWPGSALPAFSHGWFGISSCSGLSYSCWSLYSLKTSPHHTWWADSLEVTWRMVLPLSRHSQHFSLSTHCLFLLAVHWVFPSSPQSFLCPCSYFLALELSPSCPSERAKSKFCKLSHVALGIWALEYRDFHWCLSWVIPCVLKNPRALSRKQKS